MEQWESIRQRVENQGVSKRKILTETGMHWKTLEKILSESAPPGYRMSIPRAKPKIGPWLGRIEEILKSDKSVPRKQRHTAKRIHERLREEGYTGGYTQVKAAVREIRMRTREVFMPLVHRPGEAQADFGYALVKERGQLRKIVFFVMTLPYSGTIYVQCFERICMEVVWEAHLRAFEFFGGVPWRITYDNESILIAQITGAHTRKVSDGFLKLRSHYLFESHFCRIRRPNEKGAVESMIRYARLHFMVPVPHVRSLEELNERLAVQCREDRDRHVRGKSGTIEERLEEDLAAFRPLPDSPFDACRKVSTTASSLSLVRFQDNDYSVPVHYAHHPVVVKGYVDRVEICHREKRIARHTRLWGKEDVTFNPIHYLELLERKPGALDHARPLEDWVLPECFSILRRRLEAIAQGDGTREFIRVLRLLETHSMPDLSGAIEKGLRCGALTRDAIAQFLLPQEEWRETTFPLDGHPHLRHVRVAHNDISQYGTLLGVGGLS